MSDYNRPSLAFEYEIALALINTAGTLNFAETPYPAIVSGFETIVVTRNIRLVPPVYQFKPLPCGYKPAAQLIPTRWQLGLLAFEGSDRPSAGQEMKYAGHPCVARIITRLDESTTRTQYCNYYEPRIEIKTGTGDDVASISCEGFFILLGEAE